MRWAWAGALTLVAASLTGGVALANATVFSAESFARDYLDALEAGRIDEVLALPGVDSAGLDTRLLDARALDDGTESHTRVFRVQGDLHLIEVTTSAGPRTATSLLAITRIGTRSVLFPEWGFARSPISAVTISTTGDTRFVAGSIPIDLPDARPTAFAVLTPSAVTLTHESVFLTADPVSLIADSPRLDAQLAIVPNATFESSVDDALAQFLRSCTQQKVLYPTGCPFGTSVEDRLASDIDWTLPETPEATLAATATPGVWALPRVTGTAHLSVDVQNIFDGSVHRLERDVPFAASYLVAFEGDRVSVTASE